jgi:hypothetical protein
MWLSSYSQTGVLQRESASHNASLSQPAPKSPRSILSQASLTRRLVDMETQRLGDKVNPNPAKASRMAKDGYSGELGASGLGMSA